RELTDGMGREQLRADLLAGELPGHVLDAVLADVQMQSGWVIRPGAPRAVEAAVLLVHHEQRANPLSWHASRLQHVTDASRRAPAGGWVMVLMPGEVLVRDGPSAKRGD